MGKKRKQDQADDLSSSNAKRCRSCQNGKIVRPSDRMPLDGSSDVFASIRDILIQFKDIIQVKVEEKLKRKIVKLEKKREKDKNKYKEDLSVLKEDLKKELKEEVTEELRLKIQEEMRKEGCTKVHHCSASASQRSQQQSQTTRFRLEIKSKVNKKVYKGKTIQTDDGDRIEVVMKDGVNLIASGHPLSSITVQLVVLYGEFKECNREFWLKEDFEKSIIKPRQGNPRLVKNGRFKLIDGSCVHEGAVITENSNRKDVVLGVMVGEYTEEERVLEGVSDLFKVQEAKTEKDKQPSYPIATMLNSSCLITSHIEGNGQALNGNSQQYFPQVPMGISSHPISTQATQNGSVSWREQQSLPPPTVQTAYALTAANGNGPAGQLPLDRGQREYISSSNASAYLETSYLNLPEDPLMSWSSIIEGYHPSAGDVNHLDAQTQNQVTYGSHRCGQVLLLWDKPDMELRQRWSHLDQLMPLYTRHSSICSRSSPSTSLMHKVHALLASSSPDDSVVKMMRNLGLTSVTGRAMQTQKRGVLIQPIEPYDSDDEPPVKEQRHAKYQLRFANRACNDYYTSEQIKSDDGNLLKVALYDGNNMRITAGLLSSASVEVVLLHGDFNADDQDCWTSEEFNSCILCPQSGKEQPAMGGVRVLVLIDGEGSLSNANFQKTSFHARTGKFKMGVRMIVNLEERVQEGITEPFIVRNRQGGGSNINSASRLGESPMALRELPKECTTHERDGIFPPLPVPRTKRLHLNVIASAPDSSAQAKEVAPKVTVETQQNVLQRAFQTQENATPKTGFGDASELDTAQKSILWPSGFECEKNNIPMQRKLGSDGWMQMNRPESYSEMLSGFQPPKDVQNQQGFSSLSEQIAAGHSNFWHTVNAQYQDQQGNHNIFPGSWSLMPPNTGFGLNKQNYPMMQEVGGLPQRAANTKFRNGVYAALPGRGIEQYSAGWFSHMVPSSQMDDTQPCLIKPQPLVVAHGDRQKAKGTSCKLFGIHLDSPAKSEPLKSPPSIAYDGMPRTPGAAKWCRMDATELEKCSDLSKTLKPVDAQQADSVPEKHLSCQQASRNMPCKSQGGSARSCKKVHKQGIALGRSVDLTKFNGYEEFIAELDDMFDFNGELKSSNKEWMIVYTDHESDMMLVGDDPWNEFCSIVHKIFIYTREEVQRMNPGALNSRSEESPANSIERGSAAREVRGCLSTSSLNSENC